MGREAVTVSLEALKTSNVAFETLEAAFGPSSLGILLVKDLPKTFLRLREQLLSYGSYLAHLSPDQLGWSHGKEALKTGLYDTMKGSYYVNCAFYQGQDFAVRSHALSAEYPEITAPNIWPDDDVLPSFREIFEKLCTLIIDVAVLVARACDRYASAFIEGYERSYLEQVVRSSVITKARLLHYFPQNSVGKEQLEEDSWCATHIDHGCLTGLTSAMYIDEAANPPVVPSPNGKSLPPLSPLLGPPDPSAGLYIHARDSDVVKVSIPSDNLAFQTGEALQLITKGKFRAVPHFVKAQGTTRPGMKVARNTLAVFTQPDLQDVVDKQAGITFGELSREVMGRFG